MPSRCFITEQKRYRHSDSDDDDDDDSESHKERKKKNKSTATANIKKSPGQNEELHSNSAAIVSVDVEAALDV